MKSTGVKTELQPNLELHRCPCGYSGWLEPHPPQYGVMFADGSVQHAWNGKTERQRAEEFLEYVKDKYPEDAPKFKLVRRSRPDGDWEEVTDESGS